MNGSTLSSSSRSRYKRRTSEASSSHSETTDSELNSRCENLLKNDSVQKFVGRCQSVWRTDLDQMPPFECFSKDIHSVDAKRKFIEDVRVGDELCVRVKRVELAALYVQPLCVLHPFKRSAHLINDFQVLVGRSVQQCSRDIRTNDILKVVVDEPDDDHPLNLQMDDSAVSRAFRLGACFLEDILEILSENDLPTYFRNAESLHKGSTFEDALSEYHRCNNPNLAHLYGIEVDSCLSFLPELEGVDFSTRSRAPYLRRKQDEESSMQSVMKGVERIRSGESQLAIQNFNKALALFDVNIEALVGRAAAMEECNRMDEAKEKYVKVLKLKDDQRARDRLRQLQRRSPSVEEITVPEKQRKLSSAEKEELKRIELEKRETERRQRREAAEKLAEMEKFIAELKRSQKT
ncbi:unnamed protein product [Anisakis simplex]|uniref:TPR_REGION domain-containing protein n=1 Tax=Anisakis simplex TaxID=6269 RepID=A0A0M3JRN6_ANISI|nr:unnamed protein product [Anisakis simplex]